MHYYYVFDNLTDAENGLATMEARMLDIAASYGYTIDEDGCIVGKNAATGQDEPTKQRSAKWADIIAWEDGRYAYYGCRYRFVTTYETVEEGITFDYEDIDAITQSSSSSSSSSSESTASSSSSSGA